MNTKPKRGSLIKVVDGYVIYNTLTEKFFNWEYGWEDAPSLFSDANVLNRMRVRSMLVGVDMNLLIVVFCIMNWYPSGCHIELDYTDVYHYFSDMIKLTDL